MKRIHRRRFFAPFIIAVVSLCLASCNELLEAVRIPSEPQALPVIDVPNLHLQAPEGMPVGVAVAAGRTPNSLLTSPERQQIVNQHFNQITAENIMKPFAMRRRQDSFFFTEADALVNYAASNGKTVHGHTLIWHHGLPAWMNEFEGDRTAWRRLMNSHISTIMTRYAEDDIVVSWDVVNEAVSDVDADKDGFNDMRDSVWQKNIGAGYIAAAFRAAHAADPNAELYYNDYDISGIPAKLNTVLRMIRQFQQDPNPVPIHGLAFQMHITQNWPDIEQIRRSLSQAVATGLKVKISELDIAINSERSRKPLYMKRYDDRSAIRHQRRFREVVTAYMEIVPEAQRGGVSVWGVADPDTWWRQFNELEWPLLFNDDFEAKPALQGVADGLASGAYKQAGD